LDPGERACEAQHLVELLLVAPGAPLNVVEVLPPAGRVDADRLDVPEGVGADPHVFPGRRNDQLANAREDLLVLDPIPLLVEVFEAAPAGPADNSGS
jgi:hypothetical protein